MPRPGDALAQDIRGVAPVIAYAAVVAKDAAGPSELLSVALINGEDAGTLASELAPWPRKTTLPVRGDECLVIFDDASRPWVVAWNEPGWGPPDAD